MFASAMNTIYASTFNGALSLSTPDPSGKVDGLVSLFFKCVRGITDDQIDTYLSKASKENLIDTFLITFNTRDVRGGKGERDIGRKMLKWLFIHFPSEFRKIYHLISVYGRWDDLFQFFPNVIKGEILTFEQSEIQSDVVKFFANQLKTDKAYMENGNPVTLCAKWAPTENDSLDKKHKLVASLCSAMEISPRQYRKDYISPLRSYLEIVEKYMCKNDWEKIDFSKVPSCAVKKLKKAFERHLPDSYGSWLQSLKAGTSKVNAKALHPHELVREMRTKGTADQVCLSQWQVLEDEVRKLGTLSDAVVVVDVSGSMESPNYLPLDIACGLGLIISAVVEGEFKNHVITFHETPTFQVIRDGDIFSRYHQLKSIPWGSNTNITAVFDLILSKAQRAGLTNEQMPSRVLILSDMIFDAVNGYGAPVTNFEAIERKYAAYGYRRPNIVFWNVNGLLSTDFPVSVDDNGTCLVSGTSPSILKSIIKSKIFSSYEIMRTELDSDRYKELKHSLQ
jgi:hypothetical protein